MKQLNLKRVTASGLVFNSTKYVSLFKGSLSFSKSRALTQIIKYINYEYSEIMRSLGSYIWVVDLPSTMRLMVSELRDTSIYIANHITSLIYNLDIMIFHEDMSWPSDLDKLLVYTKSSLIYGNKKGFYI